MNEPIKIFIVTNRKQTLKKKKNMLTKTLLLLSFMFVAQVRSVGVHVNNN